MKRMFLAVAALAMFVSAASAKKYTCDVSTIKNVDRIKGKEPRIDRVTVRVDAGSESAGKIDIKMETIKEGPLKDQIAVWAYIGKEDYLYTTIDDKQKIFQLQTTTDDRYINISCVKR